MLSLVCVSFMEGGLLYKLNTFIYVKTWFFFFFLGQLVQKYEWNLVYFGNKKKKSSV